MQYVILELGQLKNKNGIWTADYIRVFSNIKFLEVDGCTVVI